MQSEYPALVICFSLASQHKAIPSLVQPDVENANPLFICIPYSVSDDT
jgi:hypothetical protein